VKLAPFVPAEVLQALEKENLIFKYVDEYIGKNNEAPELTKLNFTDYKGFEQYLDQINFSFDTEVEKTLNQLVEQAEDQTDLNSINLISLNISR